MCEVSIGVMVRVSFCDRIRDMFRVRFMGGVSVRVRFRVGFRVVGLGLEFCLGLGLGFGIVLRLVFFVSVRVFIMVRLCLDLT